MPAKRLKTKPTENSKRTPRAKTSSSTSSRLSGELKLKNFEKRDVEIVIENPVPGKPISASDDGQLTSDPTKLELLAREGKIRWTVKLKPDESKTLEYKYERYVPSN